MASQNELGCIPSLSICWDNLRNGVISSLSAWKSLPVKTLGSGVYRKL